ncbi:hypothetical protein FQR65_LT00690 [Abscondita terminalis]|nr:hypothetical protein FQR65_LT00690 [Abscondita terminalis]
MLCMTFHIITFGLSLFLSITTVVGSYEMLQIMYTVGFVMASLTCISIIMKRKYLIKAFETLENGIFLLNDNKGGTEESYSLYDLVTYLNKLCLLASPAMVIIGTFSYLVWKFTKYQHLPFGLFVEIINVEVTAIVQCIWFSVLGTGYLVPDMVFFIISSHIKFHLTNLQTCIENLLKNSVNDYLKNAHSNEINDENIVHWKYFQKRTKKVVSYHNAILDVSKLVEEAFHLCYLVKFICLSFCLCLVIHGMSKISIVDGLFWLLSSYLIILIIQMNIVNYYGNKIITDSEGIANCCYNIEFVGTNIKLQKSLLLMIQRSQRPITMTVGKFAPLSIATSIATTPNKMAVEKLVSEINYFGIYKKIFNFIGIYLYKSNNLNAKLCMIFHVVTFGLCICLSMNLSVGGYEIVEVMYTTGFIMVYLICVSIIIKRNYLIKVFETLENGIFLPDSDRGGIEEHLMNAWIKYLNKLCLLVSPTVVIVATCSYLVWIFTKYNQLPFGIFVEIINVETTAFTQYIWFSVIGTGYLLSDVVFFIILSHIKLHLSNLQICIQNLLQNSANDSLKNVCNNEKREDHIVEWKYLQKRLKQVVNYHTAILDVSKLIDKAFHLSYLVKFIGMNNVTQANTYKETVKYLKKTPETVLNNQIIQVEKLGSENNYFGIYKKIFNFIGIYLYKPNNLNAKFCMIFHVVTFGLCVWLSITLSVGSYEVVDLMYTTGFIMVYLVCVSIIIKRNYLIKVFETLENGIFLPDSDRGGIEEKHLMNAWITNLNKASLLASPTIVILSTCSYLVWLFTKYNQLPFGVFVEVINIDITAFIQYVWYTVIGSTYLFTNMVFFIILSHIKLHLTNLQTCLKNLLENSANDCLKNTYRNEKCEKPIVEWKYFQKRLKQVVSYHTAILDVSKLVDEAFHLCYLIKFIGISYCLCLIIHGMSKVTITNGIFWLLFFYAVTLIVPMNIVSYYGNNIILDSQNIANYCYNIEFVGTNIKLQKGLLIMIQRSQRPIVMTVGKFAPLSIATSIASLLASPAMTIIVACTFAIWKFTKFQRLPFGLFVEIINIEITAFIQCVWFSVLGSGYFFADMGFFIILSHIKLHLTNLQICIKNLLENSIDDSLKDASSNEKNEVHVAEWTYLQKRLRQIVSYRSAILDVSKLVDEVFHLCRLVKFISLSYFLCLLIHEISKCLFTSPTVLILVICSYIPWKFTKYLQLPFGLFVEIINDEITAIIQSMWFLALGYGIYSADMGAFIILSHIKLHLKNLQNCIQNILQTSTKDYLKNTLHQANVENETVEWKYLQKRLKQVIDYHVAILNVSKLVDDTFHLCQLVKFVALSFFLCLAVYELSKINVSDELFWLVCMYLIAVVVLINIVNYYGNEITIDSQNVAASCYSVDFVNTNVIFQKSLLIMIQRSQRPIIMTVGKFAPLSVATSIAIMRATYSYFMVLRNRQ